jgi:hypothetical protein
MAFVASHRPVHLTTAEKLSRIAVRSIPMKVAQANNGQIDYDGVSYFCRDYAFKALLLGVGVAESIQRALQIMLQTCLAEVKMNVAASPTIEVNFQNELIEVPVDPVESHTQHVWFDAFYYGLILRAKKSRDYLLECDYEMKFVTDDLYSPFHQGHYKFLCLLGTEMEAEAYYRAQRALDAIPEAYKGYYIYYVPLWKSIVEKDEAGFNAQWLELLTQHRNYWGNPPKDDPDRVNAPNGHNNPELTAIMAYAHDLGFKIAHQSDYCPEAMVNGDFRADVDSQFGFEFPASNAYTV